MQFPLIGKYQIDFTMLNEIFRSEAEELYFDG